MGSVIAMFAMLDAMVGYNCGARGVASKFYLAYLLSVERCENTDLNKKHVEESLKIGM